MKMKKYLLISWLGLLLAGWPLSALSETAPQPIINSFQRLFPALQLPVFSRVSSDLYQFVVQGEPFYFSGNGELLFAGKLWDVATGENLTESGLRRFRREAIESLDGGEMVTYEPAHYRYTVYAFTDVDCTYCRKFHSEMPELQKLGIRVNYLLTPLRGEESERKAMSVWCSGDRNQAMDLAKGGKPIPEKSCATPIDEHLRVSRLVGAKGTPWLVFGNGGEFGGYLPPEELLKALERDAAHL